MSVTPGGAGRPLRLLQLVHGYPPAVGGVEFAVRDLCERLVARHGAEITVLTTNARTNANFVDAGLPTLPIDPAEERNGVRVRRFPVQARFAPALRLAQGVAWRLRLPGNDWLRTWYQGPRCPGMRRAATTLEADVICAASFPLHHLFYPFHRPAPRPPVVLLGSVHTNDAWGYERRNLVGLTRRAAATVAHTDPERDWLVARGAPPERMRVIPEGIDPGRRPGRPGAFRAAHGIDASEALVAYVGQQGEHKGIDTLLRVLGRLVDARPDARLVVGGARTPYSEVLGRLAASLPERARARLLLLDDMEEQAKADLLADCDVFASPSAYESFGITVLEAWAAYRPVVAGDGPAQRSIVEEGVSGLLVPHGDEARLLAALLPLLERPQLRRELGAAGNRRLRERYTLDRVTDRYHELFQEVRWQSNRE